MTIAAAYLTSEGVVFGTDSTTTVSTQRGVSQILNYAQKIFEVGKQSRFGVCTWGAGSIKGVSHRTFVARLADKLDLEKAKVREAADTFMNIVAGEYEGDKGIGGVGYVLGGWDPDTHLPECYQMFFDNAKAPSLEPLSIGQAAFYGNPEFFSRVFHGCDNRLPGALLKELRDRNVKAEAGELDSVFGEAFEAAIKPLRAAGFRDLPIREAIDCIYTYLHITIKAFKFRYGPPICGGPIEIAFISTDRVFRWVLHKDFVRAIREVEGTII
jgi:hypothetical protein